MKVLLVSDLHGFHKGLQIQEDVDMMIVAGDVSNQKNHYLNAGEVHVFLKWYDNLPIKSKVLIAGNHDTSIQAGLIDFRWYESVIYLEHELRVIDGVTIFGSPYTPEFCNWAFNVPRDKLHNYWKDIPSNLDILVTHGPPHGVLDICEGGHVGDEALLSKVKEVMPKYHVFGHIHDSPTVINNQSYYWEDTSFHNVSAVVDGRFRFGVMNHGHYIYI